MTGEPPKVGVVDIGTNSMRLLVTTGTVEIGRWVEVTGLGRGVDATGRFSAGPVERTLLALAGFGAIMDREGVATRAAIATSATRDAADREEFLDRVTVVIGVRPEVIGGDVEGELAYAGAISDLDPSPDYVISDIGGGSTEFVTADESVSVDVGSVRLTDRALPDRPATPTALEAARAHVRDLFDDVTVRGELVGVAGTWTTLAAVDLDLGSHEGAMVHHHRLGRDSVEALIERLAPLTVEETAAIPALHPARAPVILAGAVVAGCVMEAVGAGSVLVSERDTLDGVAMRLLGLR